MKKEIIEGLGEIVGTLAKVPGGETASKNQNAEGKVGSILDTITDTLGGAQPKGQAGGGQGGCGQGGGRGRGGRGRGGGGQGGGCRR